jgi:hypothetical protein
MFGGESTDHMESKMGMALRPKSMTAGLTEVQILGPSRVIPPNVFKKGLVLGVEELNDFLQQLF